MGLEERRTLQKIKEETSIAEKEIQTKTGLPISLTVDENSFPHNDIRVLNDFFVRKIYGLTSVIKSIETICSDDMGKEAAAEKIKEISIVNTSKNYNDIGSKSVSLENSKLIIFCGFNERTDSLFKPEELTKAIEALL